MHEAVNNLERPARVKTGFVPAIPKRSVEPPSGALISTHKLKPCSVTVKDIGKTKQDICSRALKNYSNDMKRRDKKRKDILLGGLKMIKDSVKWGSPEHKRRRIDSDSSDTEDDSRTRKRKDQSKHQATRSSEDLSRIGQFK